MCRRVLRGAGGHAAGGAATCGGGSGTAVLRPLPSTVRDGAPKEGQPVRPHHGLPGHPEGAPGETGGITGRSDAPAVLRVVCVVVRGVGEGHTFGWIVQWCNHRGSQVDAPSPLLFPLPSLSPSLPPPCLLAPIHLSSLVGVQMEEMAMPGCTEYEKYFGQFNT